MVELYNERFTVSKIDDSQFDNIKRIYCTNAEGSANLVLDINSLIYKIRENDSFAFLLRSQISSDPQGDSYHWHPSQIKGTDATQYSYIMYGKVYRYEEEGTSHKATVYVSFGGLLMSLQGEQHSLSSIPTSRNIYLLMREIKA